MHPLRLAAALPIGALALTLAAMPAAAWHGHDQDGWGHGPAWRHGGADGRGHGAGPRAEARQPGTVSVTGRGESTAAPDMAVITLGVTVQAPSAAEAMRQNTARQQAVIDTLKARGIEGRDIQTSGLNLSPVQDYSREGQPPVVTGYQATNLVTVRVRDLPRLGEALDALVGAGANEIQGIGFQRENIGAAEGDARARAVENARLRAEILANAAGMELGRVVSITDVAGSPGPQPMMRAMAMDAAAEAAPVPIEAGELSVAAEVTVTWELRPAGGRGGPGGMGHHGPMQHGMGGDGMDHPHGHPGMDHGGMGMRGMPMQHGMGPDRGPEAGGSAGMAEGGAVPNQLPPPEGAAGVEADAAAAAAARATPTESGEPSIPVVAPAEDAGSPPSPAAAEPPAPAADAGTPAAPGSATGAPAPAPATPVQGDAGPDASPSAPAGEAAAPSAAAPVPAPSN